MGNKKLTESQIREAAASSSSVAEMCRQLGLIPAGGNYASVKRRITRYNINISHFTGSGWNKDNYSKEPGTKTAIKQKLIRERGHQCQKCKHTTWLDLPITLELEHVDGNNCNNEDNNLLLLCPNCHAQTKTWRRVKSSFLPNPKLICPECDGPKQYRSKHCRKCSDSIKNACSENFCSCGENISSKAKQCVKCVHVKQQRTVWPPVEELLVRLRDNKESYTSVRKSLGVSDNSVRKYLRKHGIDPKTFKPLAE
jgi:hypothetical protein